MKEFTYYKVGNKYDEFKTTIPAPQIDIRDGRILLKIVLDNLLPQEKLLFLHSNFSIKYKTIDIISLFRFTFSGIPIEVPYNPFEVNPGFSEHYGPVQGIPLIIFLAEATTGELININLHGLSHEFSLKLKDTITNIRTSRRKQYNLQLFNEKTTLFFNTHPLSITTWENKNPKEFYLRTVVN